MKIIAKTNSGFLCECTEEEWNKLSDCSGVNTNDYNTRESIKKIGASIDVSKIYASVYMLRNMKWMTEQAEKCGKALLEFCAGVNTGHAQ